MPYDMKIDWAKKRIEEFLNHIEENYQRNHIPMKNWDVLLSFSGGKDSTVLFDLVNKVHKQINSKIHIIPGYAYEITFPSTIKFINTVVSNYQKENKYIKDLMVANPKMSWSDILKNKGYPIYSKELSVRLNRIMKSKSKTGLTRWIFGINTVNTDYQLIDYFCWISLLKTFQK